MRDFEREILLEKLDKSTSSIGITIPSEINTESWNPSQELSESEFYDNEAETLKLRKYVMRHRNTPSYNEYEDEVKQELRALAAEKTSEIKERDLSFKEGRQITRRILEIRRALNAIQGGNREANLNEQARREEKADQMRWMGFLRKATGTENETTGHRR